MADHDSEKYTDFGNVEKRRNYLTAEEFPEGPAGSAFRKDEPVELKSTPWKEGQRRYTPFNYENKSLHQEMPRQMEGSHPTHDDTDSDVQSPYRLSNEQD
ncbi:cytosolic protein [Bacillus sp. BRMEA1]|uniref:cytosolic protein n=1 Tax=Neobacillus endophyticus TaxID=2738405 RepID=UPI0015679A0D|nr:cytosolic protein [Neobacillus endophyticus]NRD76405.1 cytosolic protein [Neobacillus endophyticus]